MNRKTLHTAGKLALLMIAIHMGTASLPSSVFADESVGSRPTAVSPPSGQHGEVQRKPGRMFMALADYLKLEPEVLRDKLKSASLAEIAKEQGISREDVKAKVIELLKEKVSSHPKKLGQTIDYSAAADRLLDAKGGWKKHRMHHRQGRLIADEHELAQLLKLPVDQLKASLKSGKTLAQVAKEQGVPVQSVIDQQVQALTKRLDRKLSEGKITQNEYSEHKAKLQQFVSDVVNGKLAPLKPQQPQDSKS